jgi:3-oxoacyl-[acyl-carrier protein] reductase
MTRRVLVTGSSRGIGRAIALRLAQAGWSVAIHFGSRKDEAEQTAHELGDAASGIYQADLKEPDSTSALFKAAIGDGDIHAIVNNAGVYIAEPFLGGDENNFLTSYQTMMAVNFESPVRLIREAGAYFSARGEGKILNVASRVGFKGEAGAAIYAASKAALINLTRSLAVEWAPQNIGIFCIAPGWVDTAMVRDGMDERLAAIIATLPLGRMGSPEDCAATAAFLLSDEAAYLSGITIDINGASYFH